MTPQDITKVVKKRRADFRRKFTRRGPQSSAEMSSLAAQLMGLSDEEMVGRVEANPAEFFSQVRSLAGSVLSQDETPGDQTDGIDRGSKAPRVEQAASDGDAGAPGRKRGGRKSPARGRKGAHNGGN